MRKCWPSRRGDELAAGDGLIHCDGFILTSRSRYLETHRWIATARLSLKHASRSQYLGGVTDGSNRLIGIRKMTHDFQDPSVEPKVLSSRYRRTSAPCCNDRAGGGRRLARETRAVA